MLKISIPTPCHEDWNEMTPDETGRHCSTCAKSVVDFTNMSDEEVKHFFLHKKQDERVCGRFNQTQLHRITIELPQNIFHMQMPLWKKFLAACLVVFSTTLFSCDIKMANKGYEETVTTGMIMLPKDTNTAYIAPAPALPPPPAETKGIVFTPPQEIKGDILIEEIQPAAPIGITQVEPVKDTTYSSCTGEPLKTGPAGILIKTKDPQKADPENCKTIKNYN